MPKNYINLCEIAMMKLSASQHDRDHQIRTCGTNQRDNVLVTQYKITWTAIKKIYLKTNKVGRGNVG